MRTNPVRVALRDGFRCVMRFKRIWLLFALLALAYSAFQFVVFTPAAIRAPTCVWSSLPSGNHGIGRGFSEVWRESLLHTARISRRYFRRRCDHLSALGSRRAPPDSELARPASQSGARLAQAIRSGRLVDLFRRVAQRARFAPQAADLLAAARSRGSSLSRRTSCRPRPRSIPWLLFSNISARFTCRFT